MTGSGIVNLAEPDNSELSALFDYVGKKFKNFEQIDTNWGLHVSEALDFPAGVLYAADYDQAGTEYWFYDGVLSYGVYVWYLLGAVCSMITIEKGKHISSSGSFQLEENPEELPQKPSACSELFAAILCLNMKAFETEEDLVKEASRLLEGVASFSGAEEHEYSYLVSDKCMLTFYVLQGEIDGICLAMTEEAQDEADRAWEEERAKNG